MADDDKILNDILAREGGYVDDPADHGGATNHGITLETLSEVRGRKCSKQDVFDLTVDEAREIYRQRYLIGPGFNRLTSPSLRSALADYAVNSGQGAAIRALQSALGVTADGVIGDQTATAANARDGFFLAITITATRLRFLARIVDHDATQRRFAAGWMNRIADVLDDIL